MFMQTQKIIMLFLVLMFSSKALTQEGNVLTLSKGVTVDNISYSHIQI